MINNQFFNYLAYIFLFHFFERMHKTLIQSPILMHSWIGMSEFLFLHHKSIYEIWECKYILIKLNKIRNASDTKIKVEIIFFPILLLDKLLFDICNWIIIILYLVFLKLKCHTNKRSKVDWIQIDYFI
ncbi:unnamed protein product [Paramecium octaurelia]|uniref:Uncharacterized protein n=1 Tax=Paramecium octaurelia TaxID=43137 RepID=A0A8S1TVH5_PAROT|nr:unnamed protein product [Paramecium octaurelia]